MEDSTIIDQIGQLVDQERELRERLRAHAMGEGEANHRLDQIETQLDQCWDLLRQRKAAREFGQDPGETKVRPAETVEGYES